MILIIIPFRNEQESIEKTLSSLYSWCSWEIKKFEILLINDHSSDKTQEKIGNLGFKKVQCIKNKFDPGKGSALKTAAVFSEVMYALKGEDSIFFIDGDGQFDFRDIKMFINLMKIYNADIVIGNKRHVSSSVCYNLSRRIVSSGYNILTRFLFGFNFRDTQSGMKLFKKKALDKIIEKVNSKRYAFDLEVIVAMREMRFRVIDAPVKVSRAVNNGSVRFSTILFTLWDTLVILINKMKGKYA